MKKLLILCLFLLLTASSVNGAGLQPQDLVFTPSGGGKFIYSNNREGFQRDDLSDISNPNPVYLMNNDNLKPGKYSMFVSHINNTATWKNGKRDSLGFDAEVDVLFNAKEDTQIIITAVGFDALITKAYVENGNIVNYTDDWACLNAWVNYEQMNLFQLNHGNGYYYTKFEPVIIDLKAGEQDWLSKYISNYSVVGYLKPSNILADFEIISGSSDVNVAALKSNGILGDRSNHSPNAKPGHYIRDKQYKGIADTLPTVNTSLNFTVDDNVKAGTLLPVIVYNQYVPDGNTVAKWYTNINPQADIWSRNEAAESDMLSFTYEDETKLNYYGKSISPNKKDKIWIFDVFHSDTDYGPIPNYKMTTAVDKLEEACNLGNYGVSMNYKVTIENKGSKTRYANYKLNTAANNIVILRDEKGNPINEYAISKGVKWEKKEDIMASVTLPAKQKTTFVLEVILPTNQVGGMQNSFEISDVKHEIKTSGYVRENIWQGYQNTGREYIKWYGGSLFGSADQVEWHEIPLSDSVKEIFNGNWNNYEIKYFNGIYMVRWREYDQMPHFYKDVLELCNKVYFLNEDFNLLTTHTFEGYPSQIQYNDGQYIVKVNEKTYKTTLPLLEKTITVKVNGEELEFDTDPIIQNDRTLVPMRLIFEKLGAFVVWNEDIRTAVAIKGKDMVSFTIGSNIAYVNNKAMEIDVPAIQQNFRTLVPIRFLSEKLGYDVGWDEAKRTVYISK